MSIFKGVSREGIEESGDVLGGFRAFESDAYEAIIKVVYAGEAQSGAKFLGVHLNIDGKEYREQIYFTNRNGENYYVDKQTGKKKFLPGFQTLDELCLMATEQPLEEQEVENKVIKLWDRDAGAETNQSVPVLVNLTGKKVVVGIIKQIVDKTQKDGAGNYVPTGETREENVISKIFHPETQGTITEYTKDLKLGDFYEAWVEQNKGNTINRAKGAGQGGQAGHPGKGNAGGPPAGTTKSLFSK